MKLCRDCGEFKPVSEFYSSKTHRGGLKPQCKPCFVRYANSMRRNDLEGSLIQGARSNAKRRGIPFSLTRDDIVIPKVCPVLGIPLRKAHGRMDDSSPSIDRLDSSLGYSPDNIRIVSWKANRIKSNATLSDLRALVSWLETTR